MTEHRSRHRRIPNSDPASQIGFLEPLCYNGWAETAGHPCWEERTAQMLMLVLAKEGPCFAAKVDRRVVEGHETVGQLGGIEQA